MNTNLTPGPFPKGKGSGFRASSSLPFRERGRGVRFFAPTTTATPRTQARPYTAATADTRRRNWLGAPWWLYLLLLLGGLCMIVPFVWMLATSFKPNPEIYTTRLIPQHPTLTNYTNVLEKTQFPRWFLNSLIIAGITTLS